MRTPLLLAVALTVLLALPDAARASEAGPGAPPPMVRIKSLMLPVLGPKGGVEKYTQVEVALEIGDAMKLPTVQEAMPRLQDAILTELYHAVEVGWIVRGSIANASALRKRLDEASETLVGKNVVSRVLITPVARQSSWP